MTVLQYTLLELYYFLPVGLEHPLKFTRVLAVESDLVVAWWCPGGTLVDHTFSHSSEYYFVAFSVGGFVVGSVVLSSL